jgi:hypothetical protein
LFKSKEKHLKQGEKISNLENASCNPIHIPLTICKKNFEKIFQNNFAKTKQVVQAWSKMLIKESNPCISSKSINWFNFKQPLHLPYAN